MRLCGLVLCKRILLALLLDKVSRGTGRLPWVPFSASPPFCFRSTHPPKQNGGQVMTTINLKDFYYWYIVDELVEVPDEVAEALMASRRDEASYQRRLTRTVMTGSNIPRACMSPAPRSSWIGKSCFSVCGMPSTPCRRSRAAGWTLT